MKLPAINPRYGAFLWEVMLPKAQTHAREQGFDLAAGSRNDLADHRGKLVSVFEERTADGQQKGALRDGLVEFVG